MDKQAFKSKIYNFYQNNRRSFPWRETQDPYKIMVSEFMLQQTQTHRVLPKFEAFIKKFPTLNSLALASLSEVLSYWQGLGYNSRGKRLHDSAKKIMIESDSVVPATTEELIKLPGIGPYTAAAISTFAYNRPEIFIETNIRTVYIHFFFKDVTKVSDKQILELVSQTIDLKNPRDWYYALMDYGVYLKQTIGNLNKKSKHYTKQTPFKGSNRQIRGKILKNLLENSSTQNELTSKLGIDKSKLTTSLAQLIQEKMIVEDEQGRYTIPD